MCPLEELGEILNSVEDVKFVLNWTFPVILIKLIVPDLVLFVKTGKLFQTNISFLLESWND